MKNILRSLLGLSLAAALAGPAFAICTPTISSVDGISVTLLSADPDEIHRREFAEISDTLATLLGISAGDVDADDEAPNPQIRVRIESTPAGSGITSNNAVFTVVAIRTDAAKRLWVYSQTGAGDKDAGQFKLFAKTDGSVYATPDSEPDGLLDNILVRAFTVPVASSAFTTRPARPPRPPISATPALRFPTSKRRPARPTTGSWCWRRMAATSKPAPRARLTVSPPPSSRSTRRR